MGFFDKIKAGLTKTRDAMASTLGNVFQFSQIDEDFYEELEESLILADMGVETAVKAITTITVNTVTSFSIYNPNTSLSGFAFLNRLIFTSLFQVNFKSPAWIIFKSSSEKPSK